MKKSLSLLLAFALVFSMFSSLAFAADSQTAAQKLVNAGIIKGSASGDLMENETWKRQDVTVIISRLLGVEQEAQNTAKNHSFADVTDPYYDGFITYAYENGYFNGHSEIRFGYGEEITVKQFVAVMLRVLGYDVAWDEVEEVAVEVGLVPAGTDFEAAATRGEYFTIIDTTLQTETADGEILGESLGLEGYAPEAPEVAVNAVGAKKIQVAFNKAVNKDQATFTVKKGNNTVTVNKISWSDDNKTATIETAAKLTKGDYTVTVKGVAESDYNLTLTAEDEKVATVKITNENAPLKNNAGDAVYVYFRAENQYGENVTRSNQFTVSVSKGTVTGASSSGVINANKGVLELNAPGAFKYTLNEELFVSITYVDQKGNFASDSRTVKVAAPAKVAKVDFTELYNKDDKQIDTETRLAVDEFYVLIEAEDQYGNKVTAAQLNSDVIVSNSSSHILGIGSFATINDGVKEDAIGLQLLPPTGSTSGKPGQAGTVRLMVVSTIANSSDTFDFEVVQASRLESLVIGSPDVIPFNEKVEIPFEAYDQNGNEITSSAKIKEGINGGSLNVSGPITGLVSTHLYFEDDPNTNKAKLYLDTTGLTATVENPTPISISGMTKSLKPINAILTVSPKAKPVAIVKVDEVDGAVVTGGTTKIKLDKISIEDQYGRTKDGRFFTGAGYAISVTVDTYGPQAVTVSDTLLTSGEEATITGGALSGNIAVDTIVLKVQQGANVIENSEYKLRIRNVSVNLIESYEVVVADVYLSGGTAYGQKPKITGKLSDGTSVGIPALDASGKNSFVEINVAGVSGLAFNSGEIYVNNPTSLGLRDSEQEKTFALPFIGQTKDGAKHAIVELKVSKATPKAESFKIQSSGTYNRVSDNVVSVPVGTINGWNSDPSAGLIGLANAAVEVKDQYGKTMTADQFISAAVVSYSDPSPGKNLSNVSAGETVKVIAYTKNAKPFEFYVKAR